MAKNWTTGAWVLLAVAALSSGYMLTNASQPAESTDSGAAADARFAAAVEAMPKQGTVGYVSDIGGAGFNSHAAFYQAQYALAPLLLEPGAKQSLILGNFSSPAAIEAALRDQHLTIERDFGNGVLALRKAAQ